MEGKIYVKLKDTTGCFYIASQGLSVNRTQVKEVANDSLVSDALRHGGLVKATKAEFEASKKDNSESQKKAAAKAAAKYDEKVKEGLKEVAENKKKAATAKAKAKAVPSTTKKADANVDKTADADKKVEGENADKDAKPE